MELAGEELATPSAAAHDSSVSSRQEIEHLTRCYVLESEPSRYLSKHIHELIGKDEETDQLSKEKLAKNIANNSWDTYTSTVNAEEKDSDIPTKVYHAVERHIEMSETNLLIFLQ